MFRRDLTFRIIIAAALVFSRALDAEFDALNSLLTLRRGEGQASERILSAMRLNSKSSYDIMRRRFNDSIIPSIYRHGFEDLYTGYCWKPQEPESAEFAVLLSVIYEKKLRFIPDFSVYELEVSSKKARKRYIEKLKKQAPFYSSAKPNLTSIPYVKLLKHSLSESWTVLVSPQRAMETGQMELFRLRELTSGQGFILEEPCTNLAGCQTSPDTITPMGEAVRLCAFTSNGGDSKNDENFQPRQLSTRKQKPK